jgi:hypothetical protein
MPTDAQVSIPSMQHFKFKAIRLQASQPFSSNRKWVFDKHLEYA